LAPRQLSCLTSEAFSTKMDWRTGTQKAAVYRVPAHPDDGKLTVMATTLEKSMPRVTPEHEAAVLRFYDARKQRAEASRRRIVGGDGGDDNEDGRPAQLDRFEAFHRGQRKMLRYPEVHGLRFVHEAGIHQNRDLASSQSISRLCVLKISKGERPSVFCFQRRAPRPPAALKVDKKTRPKKKTS